MMSCSSAMLLIVLLFAVTIGTYGGKCPKSNSSENCHFHGYYETGTCIYSCLDLNRFPEIGADIGSFVQELWLEDSNITSIDQNDFKTLTNVLVVNLHYCNLQFVSSGTFSKLLKLQYLTLSWNPLTLEAVTSTFCSLPQSSQELNVTLKGIFEKEVSGKFPASMLKCLGLRNITTLDLSVNMLSVSHIESIFCASKRTVSNYILNSMTLVEPLRIRRKVFRCF